MLHHNNPRQATDQLASQTEQSSAEMPDNAIEDPATGMPPILATKLALPALGSDHLPRLHLVRRLEQADRPLTLIVAPQGYGKTTLLSEWAQQSQQPIAWVALDRTDSEPQRFWRYLITALDLAQQGVGNPARELLTMHQESFEESVVTLINMLTIAEPMILVLDSYERITNMAIHQALDFLLDHLPPTLRIVIACRGEPPLALARRRSTDQLTEFGVADLQFTGEEMARLLYQVVGYELSFDQRSILANRIEGWVAGIRLVARLLRNTEDSNVILLAFSGAHRDVQDYLDQEVLSHLSGELQAFMLQTALFERLSAPLCEAVLSMKESHDRLVTLERSGLFLFPMDTERYWYRYHPLVAEALRYRLYQEAPDLTEALRQRIAEWSTPQHMKDYTSALQAVSGQPLIHETALSEQAVGSAKSYNLRLSQREHEVLQLLADGRSNQEIATILIIGINTVKMHIQHLYDKFDVHNRVQAVARARSLGLL